MHGIKQSTYTIGGSCNGISGGIVHTSIGVVPAQFDVFGVQRGYRRHRAAKTSGRHDRVRSTSIVIIDEVAVFRRCTISIRTVRNEEFGRRRGEKQPRRCRPGVGCAGSRRRERGAAEWVVHELGAICPVSIGFDDTPGE